MCFGVNSLLTRYVYSGGAGSEAQVPQESERHRHRFQEEGCYLLPRVCPILFVSQSITASPSTTALTDTTGRTYLAEEELLPKLQGLSGSHTVMLCGVTPPKQTCYVELFQVAVAAVLHDEWRKPRLLPDGTYNPRPKEVHSLSAVEVEALCQHVLR